MRKIIFAAVTAFVIGGVATGAALSQAQPSPPQVDASVAPPAGGPHPWGGWGHAHGGGSRGGSRPFALVYRQADRQLVPADVQKIAEAFLLWNGNHTWKVTDVAATADGPISFSLTTPEGSVVARFMMDPHTAAIRRTG